MDVQIHTAHLEDYPPRGIPMGMGWPRPMPAMFIIPGCIIPGWYI